MSKFFSSIFCLSLLFSLSSYCPKPKVALPAAESDSESDSVYDTHDSGSGSDSEASGGSANKCLIDMLADTKLIEDEESKKDVGIQAEQPVFCKIITRTPAREISSEFKDYINNSDSVYGSFYRFTLYDVAQAMAPKKGWLAVNHDYKKDHCEAIKHLVEKGRTCYSHNPTVTSGKRFGDEHRKFVLMQNPNGMLLWSGSWNCTANADENNLELVNVTNDPQAVRTIVSLLKELKKDKGTKKLELKDCTGEKKLKPGDNDYAKRLNRIPANKMERA